MHRLTWTMGPQALALLFSDGAHVLPDPMLESTRASAIVLVDQHAYLVFDEGLRPLRMNEPLVGDGWSVTWTREAAGRPSLLLGERTRGDDAPDGARVTVFDPEGREHPVDARPVLVGRHKSCDIPTVDRRVSLFHCALLRAGQGIRVVDLGSKNGTFVDGTRVREATLARHAALRVGRKRLELRASIPDDQGHAPARSRTMLLLEHQLTRIAPSNATVMLQGESGAGKEIVARQVHRLSGRPGPFIAINAAVLSSTLASSELFGHVRGAFTGAESDRLGAFAAADGGTLFLDEVAELSPSVQAELLRAVELRVIRRIGENIERLVDVRLVVATHRHLDALVRAERFREDLYHRLSVICLKVPALRERPEDLTEITERFLRSRSPERTLSAAAWDKLRAHAWPGNVRELINTLTRACLMCDAQELGAGDLTLAPRATATAIDHLIHDTVMQTFRDNQQNTAKTAKELGIARRTVHRLVRAGAGQRMKA